jgi:hypothetical protein
MVEDKFVVEDYEYDNITEFEKIVIREMYEKGYDYLNPDEVKAFWEKEHGIIING